MNVYKRGASFLALIALTSLVFAVTPPPRYADDPVMVDPAANKETKALYANLREIAREHVLFGQQDALAYGVMWKDWHERRSDANDVCGKFPAVYGWDLSKLGDTSYNIDTVDFKHMQEWMKDVYKNGGVNTISWHFDNFVQGTDSWDVEGDVVAAILPGGKAHQAYKDKLDSFAEFSRGLRVGFLFKKDIPLIIRPFHEHTGSWFWWGAPHTSAEDYRALWRFTVHYLRDVKQMHNLIWTYSPDVFRDKEHYLEYYPGDDYVDILGLDDYHDVGPHGDPADLVTRLRTVVELAEEKGKIAALTETGVEKIPRKDWWTEVLLKSIKEDPVASRIAWVLVWRNARTSHHFGAYPGHGSADNFRMFSKDPLLLFEPELPDLYKRRRQRVDVRR